MRKEEKIHLNINIAFPICIFLGTYMLPGTSSTSLGTAMLFGLTILIVFGKAKGKIYVNNKKDKILLVLCVYMIVNQILIMIFRDYSSIAVINNLIMNLIGIFIIIIIPQYLDIDEFYKTYKIIAYICDLGLLYHAFKVYILGTAVSPITIPILDRIASPTNMAISILRPCSFFSEPQAYCSFIAPIIILAVIRKDFNIAIVSSICIILSTSSTGIFLVAAIWVYWIFFNVKNIKIKILAITFFVVVAFWLITNPYLEYTFDKISNINLSENERTGKGFYLLKHMPIKDTLFGVGRSNLGTYIRKNHMLFQGIRSITENNYITTGFGFFVEYGVVGGILYLYLCIRMFFTKCRWARLAGILIIITSFTQTIAFNNWGIFWFVIYELIRKIEKKEENFLISLNKQKEYF